MCPGCVGAGQGGPPEGPAAICTGLTGEVGLELSGSSGRVAGELACTLGSG